MTNDKVKVLIRFGLILMGAEVREERFNEVVDGNRINAPTLAKLIDECMSACYVLTEKDVPNVSEAQKIQIRWMLQGIEGAEVVRSMDPEELGTWVFDLKKEKFGPDELMTITRSLMKREYR